jgi:lipoyl(octanoyl) transferase
MLDVKRRFGDVRAFVGALEDWVIDALADLDVEGRTIKDRVGVWVRRDGLAGEGHDKIAAIGVRLRRWVSSHGLSLNVSPELEHFSGIVPCGIRDDGVTSLAALGRPAGMETVDKALRRVFERRIEATRDGLSPRLQVEAASL